MAAPLNPDTFLRALRAEGVKVIETTGWKTHNRNHRGMWSPVHGTMLHHTVTGPKVNAVPICRDGFATLPGPLCHGVIRRDGSVHLVGYGRANHAGGGDPRVLDAVINESYGQRPPAPRTHDGGTGAVDGNAHFYGFECENLGDGRDPWPAAQVEAMVRVSAALSRAHGWTEKSVIGHTEWSDWKSDPKGPIGVKGSESVVMPDLRRRIAERLNHEPSWSRTGAAPKPTTPTPGGTPVSNLTHLVRTEDTQLLPGTPVRLYWTTEHADEPGQHGAGGYSVLSNADWSATLHLNFTGLTDQEILEVRHVETNTAGVVEVGPLANVDGFRNGTKVTRAVHLTGSMRNGDTLSFQVTNLGANTVTLTEARLVMLSWPL